MLCFVLTVQRLAQVTIVSCVIGALHTSQLQHTFQVRSPLNVLTCQLAVTDPMYTQHIVECTHSVEAAIHMHPCQAQTCLLQFFFFTSLTSLKVATDVLDVRHVWDAQ